MFLWLLPVMGMSCFRGALTAFTMSSCSSNTEICKTNCNGCDAFSFASEYVFLIFWLALTNKTF